MNEARFENYYDEYYKLGSSAATMDQPTRPRNY